MTETLSLSQARRITLTAGAGFHRPPGRGPTAVGNLVDRIGFVQIDTISVVERAHHHVLESRIPGYQPGWLDRAPVFEYWAHAAAFLPWGDFRYTLPRKNRIREHGHDWYKIDNAEADRVLERIRAEGPLMARDFEAPGKTSGWWDWKPAKRALEYLFMAGELMVLPRKGFQKVFALTESVVPPGTDTRVPSPRELADWYVERALGAWGLVARDEVAYLRKEHLNEIDGLLAEGEDLGTLTQVAVEGIPKTKYWVRTADLDRADTPEDRSRNLRILSPFDPFLIHRKRILRLFGFNYTLECYVPGPKRTFGYFGLPLFQGEQFSGLLDAKADRTSGTLVIRNLRYDGPEKGRVRFDAALTQALDRFAGFNGCSRWTMDLKNP